MTHQISVEEISYFSSPFVYIATCSCGEYVSGKYIAEKHAWNAGFDHQEVRSGVRGVWNELRDSKGSGQAS